MRVRSTGDYKGFAIAKDPCFADTSGRIPPTSQPPKTLSATNGGIATLKLPERN
jgi:hypothetical protein